MTFDERARWFKEVKDAAREFEAARDEREKERILSRVKSSLLSIFRIFVGVRRSLFERAEIQRVMNPVQAIVEVSPTVWFMLKGIETMAKSERERKELRRLLDELDRFSSSPAPQV